jgi:hypothetical protein
MGRQRLLGGTRCALLCCFHRHVSSSPLPRSICPGGLAHHQPHTPGCAPHPTTVHSFIHSLIPCLLHVQTHPTCSLCRPSVSLLARYQRAPHVTSDCHRWCCTQGQP